MRSRSDAEEYPHSSATCRISMWLSVWISRNRAIGNPAEGVWANMKNGLGNLMARDVDQLAAIIKNRLKHIQYRPALIDGFLAQTGLTLEPQPP